MTAVLLVGALAVGAWAFRPIQAVGRGLRPNASLVFGVSAASVGMLLVAVAPLFILIVPFAWPAVRVVRERQQSRDQQRSLQRHLPELLDLYVAALNAGLNIALATRAVATRCEPPYAVALEHCLDRFERGERLADALEQLVLDCGNLVRPLVGALTTSERYGVSLTTTLGHLAFDARQERHRLAEIQARRLPVLLLFPLVVCVLPAFALLTVVPMIAGALQGLKF